MNIYVITGAIQTGKTTWIGRMLDRAAERGIEVSGVLAPAVFEDGTKVAIDALLLPQRERFELGCKDPSFKKGDAPHIRPDGKMRLAWDIHDEAMDRINAHFVALRGQGFGQLMVVDEFGVLEFNANQGYVEGMAVMDEGLPANALLVLRPSLLDAARERWGEYETLGIDSDIEAFLDKIAG